MREAKKTESAGGEHSNVNSRNAGVVSPGSVSELISSVNNNQAEDRECTLKEVAYIPQEAEKINNNSPDCGSSGDS